MGDLWPADRRLECCPIGAQHGCHQKSGCYSARQASTREGPDHHLWYCRFSDPVSMLANLISLKVRPQIFGHPSHRSYKLLQTQLSPKSHRNTVLCLLRNECFKMCHTMIAGQYQKILFLIYEYDKHFILFFCLGFSWPAIEWSVPARLLRLKTAISRERT